MEGQVMVETYAQYSGHSLIKMGKKTFCDLSPPNYACDIIWEHLMMLRQGKTVVHETRPAVNKTEHLALGQII